MGYYTVVTPCVVGKLHYARVPSQPIEADDAVAGPLVAFGSLMPYPIRSTSQPTAAAPADDEGNRDQAPSDEPQVDEPDATVHTSRRRDRRRKDDASA